MCRRTCCWGCSKANLPTGLNRYPNNHRAPIGMGTHTDENNDYSSATNKRGILINGGGGSDIFLKANKRGRSEIFLTSNGNITVHCASDKHQKTYSMGETNTIS